MEILGTQSVLTTRLDMCVRTADTQPPHTHTHKHTDAHTHTDTHRHKQCFSTLPHIVSLNIYSEPSDIDRHIVQTNTHSPIVTPHIHTNTHTQTHIGLAWRMSHQCHGNVFSLCIHWKLLITRICVSVTYQGIHNEVGCRTDHPN